MGRQTLQRDYASNGTTVVYSRSASYNAKSQLASDSMSTLKSDSKTYTSSTTYNYGSGSSYALGAVVSQTASNGVTGQSTIWSSTTTGYAWYDGAVQASISHDSDTGSSSNPVYTTSFTYNGLGQLKSVYIGDGKPHTVTFTSDELGQIIRRDETRPTNAPSAQTGSPHEVWYRFGGRQMGYTGNNGTSEVSTAASIDERTATPPSTQGTFRGGRTYGASYQDFALSYDPLNSYNQGSVGGGYTVQAGDTLAGIAQRLYGDAGLWYRLAEANGLSGQASLIEGQTLILPTGIARHTHNADTFKSYDPAEAIGDLSPTTPKPKKKNKCGVFGQILVAAIAIGLSFALPALAPTVFGGIVGGMGAAAVGSAVSQGFGVATGIQDKFSFKQVGIAAISAGVGGGQTGDFLTTFAVNAAANAITQGIAVATGLQKKFDWAGVAAAGVGAAVGGEIGGAMARAGASASVTRFVSGAASTIANAATRSALTGSNFGDNLARAVPSAIGQFIGQEFANAAMNGFASHGAEGGVEAGKTVNAPKDDPKAKSAGALTTGQMAEVVIGGHVQWLGGARVAFIYQPDGKYSYDADNRVGHTNMVSGTYTKESAKAEVALTIDTLIAQGADKADWIALAKRQIAQAQKRGDPRSIEANEAFLADIMRGRFNDYHGGGSIKTAVTSYDAPIVVTARSARQSFVSSEQVAILGGTSGPIATIADTSALASAGGSLWSSVKSAGGDFVSGFIGGDRLSNGSIAAEIGSFASGVFTYGDLRDGASAIYGIYKGEKGAWGNLGLAAVGLVPVVGDVGKQLFKHGDGIADAFGEARRLGGKPVSGPTGGAAERSSLFSSAGGELAGVERASQPLLDAVSGKRAVTWATPGSDAERFLNMRGAEAAAFGPEDILLRPNPSKAAVLEEFLHGTQQRLGIVDRLGTSGLGSAETHVKDFMVRHQNMLGLSAEDVRRIQVLRDMGL